VRHLDASRVTLLVACLTAVVTMLVYYQGAGAAAAAGRLAAVCIFAVGWSRVAAGDLTGDVMSPALGMRF
jgi:hypothetical protein